MCIVVIAIKSIIASSRSQKNARTNIIKLLLSDDLKGLELLFFYLQVKKIILHAVGEAVKDLEDYSGLN